MNHIATPPSVPRSMILENADQLYNEFQRITGEKCRFQFSNWCAQRTRDAMQLKHRRWTLSNKQEQHEILVEFLSKLPSHKPPDTASVSSALPKARVAA